MLKNRIQVLTSLPHEKAEWLTKQADREYMTKSRFVEKLIDNYRNSIEKEPIK